MVEKLYYVYMNDNKNYIVFGVILGLSLILSSTIGALAFYSVRSVNTISSTGSVKKSVVSDKVKWTSSISRQTTASTLKNGYAQMDNDLKNVKNFLFANGIEEKDIIISPITLNEVWEQNPPVDKKYNLVQNIEINSAEVEKITAIAKNTTTLIVEKNIIFSTNSLEYYYSKLPETRIELLASAVEDAKVRANQLLSAGGKTVGDLKSASAGVIQVMAPNSVDVSDYGIYDTSHINKEIFVTVKATFTIN